MLLDKSAYQSCELCPRRCHVNRTAGATGVCGMGAAPKVARSALHFWEEPPISGEKGSGAIFFSGCTLKCVFCQNHDISDGGFGLEVTPARVAQMMLELEAQGAHNVNLVTSMHFAPTVREAILAAREAGLAIPVVCNTGGYERADLVRAMADVVDVWLPDFKYADGRLAGRLSAAPDYPQVAAESLTAMMASVREKGGRELDGVGLMRRGVIVRHLVLPGHAGDSCTVLDRVWDICGNDCDLSVMNQYTPNERCRREGGELSRSVTEEEYEIVLCHADDLGFENIWWQEGGTVSESFVPAFDATGVVGPGL